MDQKIFNEIMKSLVFGASCDVCADNKTFSDNIEIIRKLAENYPEEFEDINLDGIYLFGDGSYSEEPEKYKKLVEIFKDKLKVEE